MPSVCVVGAQWGDEGKASVVDLMSEGAEWVVRFQGGPNAGHTVVVGEETYKLHLVPSGMVREGVRCLIGQGVVLDLEILFRELDELEARGVRTEGRMFVSDRTHLILPYHRVIDGLKETQGGQKIGTTRKGIGPCYADKVSYRGIRVADLAVAAWFEKRLEVELAARNLLITRVFGGEPLDGDEILETWLGYRDRLLPMIIDGARVLNESLDAGAKILFEGAQGFLLDVDVGTYPYVTGSNASVLGLPAGAGISPRRVDHVIGITKAYCTRVGEGPFPTEDSGEAGDRIRLRGGEFGTTTGRPRRCGWFDAVAVRYACRVSAFDELAVTKLDILAGVETLKMATAYEVAGSRTETFPASMPDLLGAVPVYDEFPGFEEDVAGARTFEDLPSEARNYILAMEEIVETRVGVVSVGPEREQVIRRP